ncbi:MAG: bifunctional folylpolyglutamate synthase/dihydrofolate synthase [Alphaproteobacteria bacterium]
MDRSSAILQRLMSLHPRQIDLALDRIEDLMVVLGNPHLAMPPVIHVTGTNGKGSTTAFMRAMLEAAGQRVHVYASPHLVMFHERIRLAGKDGSRFVDDEELADTLTAVERANNGAPITQYEITTAAAFTLFARHPADVLLLEVGLGGRLDATNIIPTPRASVITPISLDHESFLGNSVETIAYEKAGILKTGAPAVIAPQSETVLVEIEKQAAALGVQLLAANRDWVAYPERGRLVFQDDRGLLDLPEPRLIGRHQFTNAGTAIAALRAAGFDLPDAALEAGLTRVDWPARLQALPAGPLVQHGPPNAELWLDGGHNPGAAIAVAETMADLEERHPKPLILITGMLTTKEPEGFFRPFASLATRAITVPVPGTEAGRDPGELASIAHRVGLPAEPAGDLVSALDRITLDYNGGEAPRILICGSLYLAGAALSANGTVPT